ncbi:hypothetical protein EDB19DRAFT_976598 [Suillus lakei]|nr:hypothetical protein EDB19DRAFT_976598 [Suillus lakei]
MRRMYYHRFSGLRRLLHHQFFSYSRHFHFPCPLTIISQFFCSFLLPLLPLHFRSIFFLSLRCAVTAVWICQGKNLSLVVALLSFPIFSYCHLHHYHFFSISFFLALFCVYHHITSRCVHGELDRPCSGKDDTGVYVLL